MKPIRTLIVDDSALIRHVFQELLAGHSDIEVVGTAVDAADARAKIKQLSPDVITLDIEMPGMDGLSFLEKIMALRPMPVVMVSTLTQKGAGETIRALEIGAVDYISKPVSSQARDALLPLGDELAEKLRTAVQANLTTRVAPVRTAPLSFTPGEGAPPVIALGSSTGGVEALRDIFAQLPGNTPPIVMTQHMPAQFTPSFAARLDSLSAITVGEAYDGAVLRPGHAWLAPGGRHLTIVRKGKQLVCAVGDGSPVSGHQPSVDVLFHSVAKAVGANAVGAILTGMGKDGALGLRAMRDAGARTIGQSEHSCVVYGMPRAAAAIGAVETELPLADIPAQLLRFCQQERIGHDQ